MQTVTLTGERFVILPEAEYLRFLGEEAEPQLPAPDGKQSPNVATVDKLSRALKACEAKAARGKAKASKSK